MLKPSRHIVDEVTRGPVTLRCVMPRRTHASLALVLGLVMLLAMEKFTRARAPRSS